MVDGAVLPEPLQNLFSTGRFNRVLLINGSNHDEGTFFMGMAEYDTGHVITPEEYPSQVTAFFGAANASKVLALYPLSKYGSAGSALAAAMGDNLFICRGNRRFNRLIRPYVDGLYAYEFDVPTSPSAWATVSFPYKAHHTAELQYLFPHFRGGGGTAHDLDDRQQKLAAQMVSYWTNFAHTGNPSSDKGPGWAQYQASADNYLSLRLPTPVMIDSLAKDHNCEFWDAAP
jgi:para-nitrobenzyl esterase